jgi:hypothetical protein
LGWVRRSGMRNCDAVAMMLPDRGTARAGRIERADPTKTIIPLIAALVPATTVPAVAIIAIAAAELNHLRGR